MFLEGLATDFYDLFGDGTIRLIFTPGHSVGHQSFLINLLKSPPLLLTADAHIRKRLTNYIADDVSGVTDGFRLA
jgi:glyoxylase-like metal-dependent hydrolase (beta-lactamase superfamily II)